MPQVGELAPDDCLVPAGWFWSGGDPEAANSLARRRLWCDALVVRRFPVTNREYLAFLDDLVATGREADALQYAPRERGGTAGELGALIYGFDGGRFVLRPDADGDVWGADWPVMLVDWRGASAYAAWEAVRTGRAWRLPGELEWEKAARGADGRFFPWGDGFDPSWACVGDSHSGRPLPQAVTSYPVDEGVYAVRGIAGNVRDWCADLFHAEGPPLDGERVVAPSLDAPGSEEAERRAVRVFRGGSWITGPRYARLAVRFRGDLGSRYDDLGFRLVRTYAGP